MNWEIKPSKVIKGSLTPPPDKSITHRAVMFSAIAEGESVIENYLSGEDCLSTVKAFQAMGIDIETRKNILNIKGEGLKGLKKPAKPLDAGNSGTTVRLISGILAGQDFETVITGDASLSKRPMERIIEPLSRMGAGITAKDGNFLPMTIKGTSVLKAVKYESPVASAQVKSCVLLAGLQAGGTTYFTEPVKSRDHTERMLRTFGADIRVNGLSVSVNGPAKLQARNIRVPSDISSAAFFIVAACLASPEGVTLRNVGVNPTRDGILEVLKNMGANIEIKNAREVSGEPVADIFVKKSVLRAVNIEAGIIPRLIDELPVIALAATQAKGTTVVSGAKELRVKESDRIRTVTEALRSLGAKIIEKEDGMVIEGPAKLKGAEIESSGDHRLAMTAAVAGIIAEGATVVTNIECVETSYPGFIDDMRKIGANITENTKL
ncbi:MAG: 3-phosphoshikimate 1-carboxyvinyltransferase [Elusimicrobiota bacterium]